MASTAFSKRAIVRFSVIVQTIQKPFDLFRSITMPIRCIKNG